MFIVSTAVTQFYIQPIAQRAQQTLASRGGCFRHQPAGLLGQCIGLVDGGDATAAMRPPFACAASWRYINPTTLLSGPPAGPGAMAYHGRNGLR